MTKDEIYWTFRTQQSIKNKTQKSENEMDAAEIGYRGGLEYITTLFLVELTMPELKS